MLVLRITASLLVLGIFTLCSSVANAQVGLGCAGPSYCLIHERTQNSIKNHSDGAFEDFEDNFVNGELAEDYFTGAYQYLTQQITTGSAEVTEQRANLSDAVNQSGRINAQRRSMARQAPALENTDEMCRRATMTSGITSTAREVRDAEIFSAREGINEDLGMTGTAGAPGPGQLAEFQFNQFINVYADPNDYNGAIAQAYDVNAPNPDRYNRDITPFFLSNYTLDYNITNPQATETGQDIRAFRLNLFGHDLPRIPSAVVGDTEAQDEIIDYNRVAQFQSLARRSFDSVVALRQQGNGEVATYMRALLEQRGITEPNIIRSIMGDGGEPSFMAQAKVLTTYLPRTPDQAGDNIAHSADLHRRQVTNDAVSLLIKYKIYESLKRQTAQYIAMHELETTPLQNAVERSF